MAGYRGKFTFYVPVYDVIQTLMGGHSSCGIACTRTSLYHINNIFNFL
jgi:hypothetical protein